MRNVHLRGRLVSRVSMLFAIAMVACKKDPSPAEPGSAGSSAVAAEMATEPGGRQARPPCSIVSLQEVESTLDVQGLKGPEAGGDWPVRACSFTGPPLNLPLVTVRFEVDRNATDFSTIRKNHEQAGQATKDFPGLGDAAAIVSMGEKPYGVTILYKKTVVFVSTMNAPIEKQIALARIVLQRM